jgi:hypothetical protein
MLQFRIDTADLERAAAEVQKTGESLGDAVERFMNEQGVVMEAEIKKELNVGGRIKGKGPRGGKLREHSAPGEPPRKQSGRLQLSIGYLVETVATSVVAQLRAISMKIGAIRGGEEVKYAEGLELGTSKVAPRPYLMPVVIRRLQSWGANMKPYIDQIKRLR